MLEYRRAVGKNTRSILQNLAKEDLKRRPNDRQLQRLMEEGVLTQAPDSRWLLDFWARKTVAGLLLMPITRHQLVHLNACFKLKKQVLGKIP